MRRRTAGPYVRRKTTEGITPGYQRVGVPRTVSTTGQGKGPKGREKNGSQRCSRLLLRSCWPVGVLWEKGGGAWGVLGRGRRAAAAA